MARLLGIVAPVAPELLEPVAPPEDSGGPALDPVAGCCCAASCQPSLPVRALRASLHRTKIAQNDQNFQPAPDFVLDRIRGKT